MRNTGGQDIGLKKVSKSNYFRGDQNETVLQILQPLYKWRCGLL